MSLSKRAPSPAQASLLLWISDVGAVTAEALATLRETTTSSARAQLAAAARAGLLTRLRPLVEEPAIYALGRAGMRSCGLPGSEAVRVSHANAGHLIACARVAAALARCYPDHVVLGEHALRRLERETGRVLASAVVGRGSDGEPLLHRPDLVLGPLAGDSLPIAVEVELTVKAPRRLAQICRAWARCHDIAGVLYLAATPVERALGRAIADAHAHAAIIALPLSALAPDQPPLAGGAGRAGVVAPGRGAGRGRRRGRQHARENRRRTGVGSPRGTAESKEIDMPFSINRVVVVGRLTRDPELRALPSGTSVCDLRIAVNSARKDAAGEWSEKPNYFDVSIFGTRAETVASYMRRGSRVGVDGRLDWREWETDEQQKRQAVSIVADTVQFLDGRDSQPDDGEGGDEDLAGVGAQDGDLAF